MSSDKAPEKERFRELRDMYLDHMEGTNANEFEFWQALYLAAQLIVETMEREEKTGSPYPWGKE